MTWPVARHFAAYFFHGGVVLAGFLWLWMLHGNFTSRGDPAPPIADLEAHGAYIAHVCTGCHGARLTGGRMVGGPPNIPPPANLTAHASGLGSWSETDFLTAMRTGKRPDGSSFRWRGKPEHDGTQH